MEGDPFGKTAKKQVVWGSEPIFQGRLHSRKEDLDPLPNIFGHTKLGIEFCIEGGPQRAVLGNEVGSVEDIDRLV